MKRKLIQGGIWISLAVSALLVAWQPAPVPAERWTQAAANKWDEREPWLVGSNYIPSDAINELEMWQAGTFDPKRIDLELGWAEGLGMNTMRVFLHDLLWKQDSEGVKSRIGTFLEICERHKIKPIFVLFDSCWDPFPHLGKQRAPALESITRVGCRVPARRRSKIPYNTLVWKPMSKGS